MSTQRGQDGLFSLGGLLVGTPELNGALIATAIQMDIDGASLVGVVMVGDTFTIEGEAGSPTHTVTNGPFYVAAANAVNNIDFTPGIAAGGVADGADVTFTAESVAELTAWSLDEVGIEMADDTVKGDTHRTFKGGLASWRGSATALLDYGDTEQAALIDAGLDSASGTLAAIALRLASGKIWYGAGELAGLSFGSPDGTAPCPFSFTFQGSGEVLPDWN